jgi:hypothetical protein
MIMKSYKLNEPHALIKIIDKDNNKIIIKCKKAKEKNIAERGFDPPTFEL